MVDFPVGVPANDPDVLLGANATSPAKTPISAAGRSLIAGDHVGAVDPHGDRVYTDAELAAHVADVDPHGDRAYSDAALAAHVAAANPHPDYETAAEAQAKADAAQAAAEATAAAALAAHDADPGAHGGGGGGVTDHGALTGLADDDHGHYHNDARGDARYTQKANNLSDLANAGTARTNLGLGTAATHDVPASGNAAAGEVVKGSDTRLTDARTPTAHATTHQSGGSDPIKLDDLATPDDNTDLDASATRHGLLPKLSNVATEFLNGQGAWATPAGGGGGSGLTLTPTAEAVLYEDFMGQTSDLVVYASGAGAGVTYSVVSGYHYAGVLEIEGGTSGTGFCAIGVASTSNGNSFDVTKGAIVYETRVAVLTLSSGATTSYAVVAGLSQSVTFTNQSVVFRYRHDINGGAWRCECWKGGAFTLLNSAVTVATNTWYRLRIEIAADGSSATFYINGTLVGTISTNIPAATVMLAPCVINQRAFGSTTRPAYCDYVYAKQTFTSPR